MVLETEQIELLLRYTQDFINYFIEHRSQFIKLFVASRSLAINRQLILCTRECCLLPVASATRVSYLTPVCQCSVWRLNAEVIVADLPLFSTDRIGRGKTRLNMKSGLSYHLQFYVINITQSHLDKPFLSSNPWTRTFKVSCHYVIISQWDMKRRS